MNKMVVVTVGGESYYMNEKVKNSWDKIRGGKLKVIDEDRVYIVDGREGSGKSVWALQQAAYIDPSIINDLSRITFSPEETLEAIRNNRSTSRTTKVIVFDEAFRGLSSKSALSTTNKKIVQALMECRQNNLVLFLVSPSFFLLELYSATIRSHALFHVVKDKKHKPKPGKKSRRYFRVFSEKKKGILYRRGIRKGWDYNMPTKNRDRFFEKYPGGPEFEAIYRAKKYKATREADTDTPKEKSKEEIRVIRNELINHLSDYEGKIDPKPLAHMFGLSVRTINHLLLDMHKK